MDEFIPLLALVHRTQDYIALSKKESEKSFESKSFRLFFIFETSLMRNKWKEP